jgi:pimeloyl-ACP methyl ester carboxylesterase
MVYGMHLEINGSFVSYEVIGEGTPVVILHGLGVDRAIMKGFLEPVFHNMNGYKRIYLDLPVMGESIAGDSLKSSDDMLKIVIYFIDKVIPNIDFLVVGLSYGGYLARGIANRRPDDVKGMRLVCP